MAKSEQNESSGNQGGSNKRKGFRTTDDMELLKLILEENPRLKSRVVYILEAALQKRPGQGS